MANKNIFNVYQDNPITTNQSADLMYFGRSPYGTNDDAAMIFSDFAAQFGAPFTPAALTRINDSNVTVTLGGSPSTALLQATSLTLGWTGQLSVPRGGTGNSTFTAYSVICAGTTATGTFQNVAGVGTANQVLVSNGAAALPTWQSVPGLTPAALTETDDTNVTLTLGGTPATALLQATSITAGWTGTLAVGRGGLGIATIPSNGQIPIGNGTNYTANTITAGTGVNVSNGAGTITLSTASAVATSFATDSGTATPSSGVLTITGSTTGLTTTGSGSTVGMTGTLNAGHGGSGLSSLTTYALLTGGTTATGNFQQVATGTSGQVLQSAGASALPAYSTATYPSAGGTTGTILRSNGTNWVNSTATFADTYGASTLLYSNGANTVTGLATANSAMIFTSSTGVPAWTGSATNGQVLIGSSGASPALGTITAGTGISVTNGAGSITIASTGGGLTVTTISGTTQTAAVNNLYIALNAGQTTVTLPATYAVGDRISLIGATANTGGWIVTANTGDTVRVNNGTTTAGGSVTSSAVAGQTIELICDVANTSWVMIGTASVTLTTS